MAAAPLYTAAEAPFVTFSSRFNAAIASGPAAPRRRRIKDLHPSSPLTGANEDEAMTSSFKTLCNEPLRKGWLPIEMRWIVRAGNLTRFGRLSFYASLLLPTWANGGQGLADYSVLEHHNSPLRIGLYVDPSFTRKAASGIHLDFSTAVDGAVNAQPLFLDGL